ncbi:MAG: hypothetical protein Q4P28_06240 [Tissierellia bacterium]|nr:hypothetical protein [Tissierellia bacterium]
MKRIFCILFTILFTTTSLANSGPPRWNRGKGMEVLTDNEKPPVEMVEEQLLITNFKPKDYSLKGNIHAKYHYKNLGDALKLHLSFPMVLSLEEYEESEIAILKNGKKLDFEAIPSTKEIRTLDEYTSFPILLDDKIKTQEKRSWVKKEWDLDEIIPFKENDPWILLQSVEEINYDDKEGYRLGSSIRDNIILYYPEEMDQEKIAQNGNEIERLETKEVIKEWFDYHEIELNEDVLPILEKFLNQTEELDFQNDLFTFYRTNRVLFLDYELDFESGEEIIHEISTPIFTSMIQGRSSKSQILRYDIEPVRHFEKYGKIHVKVEVPEDYYYLKDGKVQKEKEITMELDPETTDELLLEFTDSPSGKSLLGKKSIRLTIWHILPIIILLCIFFLYYIRSQKRKDQQEQIDERLKKSRNNRK